MIQMAGSTAILAIRIVANSLDAQQGLRRTAREAERFQRKMNAMNATRMVAVAGTIGHVAVMMAAATAATAPLIGAVGVLGVGLAGLAVAATPALAAVALGFDGIKAAAKTITPQFDAIKAAVSSTFEQGMTPAFAQLGTLLTSITPAMQGVASAVSTAFGQVVAQITGPGKAGIDAIIAGGQQFVTMMGPGLAAMTQGFIDFGAAAAPVMGQMGQAFGDLLGKIGQVFSKLAESGQLTKLFDGFNQVLGGLGDLLGPLVEMFVNLGVAMGPSLAGILSTLGSAITAITPGMTQIAAVMGQALLTAIQNLVPHLPAMVAGFVGLLNGVTPLIGPISALVGQLLPFAPVIVVLVAAFKTWGIVMGILSVVTAILNVGLWSMVAALLANPITWIVLAVVALIAGIVLLATKTQFFQTIWAAMVAACVAVWNAIVAAVQWLWDLLQTVGGWIAGAFVAYWSALQAVAVAVWEGIKAAVQTVWDILQTVASFISGTVSGAFSAVQGVAVGVWNAIKGAIDAVVGAIQAVINWIGNIHWPSPPSWLTSLFSGATAELIAVPPTADVFRFLPMGYETFAAKAPELTAASVNPFAGFRMGGSGGGSTNLTTINITVEGAIDPISTANQIRALLSEADRITGANVSVRL